MTGRDKGVALIITMIAVVMIAGMSVAADFRMDEFRAFQIAQAAVERVRATMEAETSEDPTVLCAAASFGADFLADEAVAGESCFPGTTSAGEYFATVTQMPDDPSTTADDGRYHIRAGGRRPSPVAAIKFVTAIETVVVATPPPPPRPTTATPFKGGGFSEGTFEMSGGTVNSYNSDDGPYDPDSAGSEGDVGSNGDVILSGTVTINGDVSASGTVTGADGDNVTGTISEGVAERDLPSVTDVGPDFLADNDNADIGITAGDPLSVGSDYALPSGTYYFGAVDVANNKVLTIRTPCKVYMNGALDIKPNADIVIDTSGGGSVEFYLAAGGAVKGPTSLSTTVPLTPSDFQIYSHGTAEITLQTPHVALCASIYAPDAPIRLMGNPVIDGSIVGDTVTVSSAQTEIHYDTALAGVSVEVEPPAGTPPPTWDVSSQPVVWRQIR